MISNLGDLARSRSQAAGGETQADAEARLHALAKSWANVAYAHIEKDVLAASERGRYECTSYLYRDDTELSLETANRAADLLRERFRNAHLGIVELYAYKEECYEGYNVGVVAKLTWDPTAQAKAGARAVFGS